MVKEIFFFFFFFGGGGGGGNFLDLTLNKIMQLYRQRWPVTESKFGNKDFNRLF